MTATLHGMLPLHQWIALSNDAEDGTAAAPAALDLDSDWLFATSGEAALILDAETGVILRANPTTSLLLNRSQATLVGAAFWCIFDDLSAAELQRDVAEAKRSGSAAAATVTERGGGRSFSVHLSLVRSEAQNYVLARLESLQGASARAPNTKPESAVMEAIDAAPMGFLIATADFHAEYANRAFVRMIKAQSQAHVRGSSVLRWLRFSAADLSRLSARLSQRQAADVFTAALHPNSGQPQQVEVCAVPVPDGFNTQWGFTVRALPRLN